MQDNEKRMAGDYEIIHALQVGDREIVIGENLIYSNGQNYMCAFCTANELFEMYTMLNMDKTENEIVDDERDEDELDGHSTKEYER